MTKLFLTLLNVGITAGWLILAAWGMWDIKPALYDNEVKNCLVATYGIQGLAENQADSVAGAAASYEQVVDEYRDMVQNHFYMDLQAKDRDAYEKSFGPDIGEEIRMYEQSVFYALYDIDGNGTEELIIAAGEPGIGVKNPRFQPKNYDIYTS